MKITKSKIRKRVINTLGEYGVARPPLADDLADAIFDLLKEIEKKLPCAICGRTDANHLMDVQHANDK